MAVLRMLLVMAVLLLCMTKISSDAMIGDDMGHMALISLQTVRGGNRRLMAPIDCAGLCEGRCSAHSRPNTCMRACGTCCLRCKCVPPGTSGNRDMCGKCYTDMLTHGNKPKCP